MRSRLLTLAIALSLAGIAVAVVYMYVQGVETRSTQGLATTDVLVASRSLPAGISGKQIVDANGFRTESVPRKYAQPGALTSSAQLAGLTLSDDVAAGQQLTSAQFRSSPQDAFLSQFPKGTEAISLPLDYVRSVSGHLGAGDRIDAYVTAEAKSAAARYIKRSSIPSSARVFDIQQGGVTVRLLKQIPVMEVDQSGLEQGQATMTLAVTPEQAALLIHSQETATLWFTLAPHGAA